MAIARAYTNIALIKYWGKRDEKEIIPFNNSISLTLDQFYTETSVEFLSHGLSHDTFYFSDEEVPVTKRIQKILDLVRTQSHLDRYAIIRSANFVPTSAGLASSSSAFAALALAASSAADLQLSKRELSILARHGSGSASRSIYGGFVEWQAGFDNRTSYAEAIQEQVDFPIAVIAVLVSTKEKLVLSSAGMQQSVRTSPYYQSWVKTATAELAPMRAAISEKDINQIGQIAERNAMQMHATTLSANPPFSYFAPETLQIWREVEAIRRKELNCYLTLDAGPNPKLICALQDTKTIIEQLKLTLPQFKYVVCQAGPAARLIK